MRRVKVENVRIGDWITERVVNGRAAGIHGTVVGIVHLSPTAVDFHIENGEGVQTHLVMFDARWTVYRER